MSVTITPFKVKLMYLIYAKIFCETLIKWGEKMHSYLMKNTVIICKTTTEQVYLTNVWFS